MPSSKTETVMRWARRILYAGLIILFGPILLGIVGLVLDPDITTYVFFFGFITVPFGILVTAIGGALEIILRIIAYVQKKHTASPPPTLTQPQTQTCPTTAAVEPPKTRRTLKFYGVIVAAVILVGYSVITNSYSYIRNFSEPIEHSGGDGYYVVSYPTHKEIYFYRAPGGGELGFGKSTIAFVNGADPKTFTTLGPLYAKDKDHVYFTWGYFRTVRTLSEANPDEFVAVDPYYGHDSTTIYYGDRALGGSSPTDFKFLDTEPSFKHYGGDPRFLYTNGHIYYADVEISSAKRNPAYVVSAALKSSMPCNNIEELKGGAFSVCAYPNVGSDTTVPIDAASFQIIEHSPAANGSYAKDKNHVYYIDRDSCGENEQGLLSCGGKYLQAVYVVEGADPNTFVSTNAYQPATDRSYGQPGNFGYDNGCVRYIGAVLRNGETQNVLVQHKTLPRPNVGYGGRCVYYTSDENPR